MAISFSTWHRAHSSMAKSNVPDDPQVCLRQHVPSSSDRFQRSAATWTLSLTDYKVTACTLQAIMDD
eukprot:508959-Pleurochrysis_carterae.AAC.1